jgi:hypothetical protein
MKSQINKIVTLSSQMTIPDDKAKTKIQNNNPNDNLSDNTKDYDDDDSIDKYYYGLCCHLGCNLRPLSIIVFFWFAI